MVEPTKTLPVAAEARLTVRGYFCKGGRTAQASVPASRGSGVFPSGERPRRRRDAPRLQSPPSAAVAGRCQRRGAFQERPFQGVLPLGRVGEGAWRTPAETRSPVSRINETPPARGPARETRPRRCRVELRGVSRSRARRGPSRSPTARNEGTKLLAKCWDFHFFYFRSTGGVASFAAPFWSPLGSQPGAGAAECLEGATTTSPSGGRHLRRRRAFLLP